MRWTNYFLHPSDNRFYVFTFREEEHAKRFELALIEDNIPYERNEKEFGVPRTHFNEALRHNHLLHADIRKPFIENKGLRFTMLIITGAMLLLAIVGAFSSKAYGQQMDEKYGWELAIQGRVSVPFGLAGVETQTFEGDGLASNWNPLTSQSFGVRINNRLRESWTLGTGIMWIRRNYSIDIHYANDTLSINTSDTIPLLRSMSYRIPIIAETRVELGNGFFVTAAGGVGIEFVPSNTFQNGYTDASPESSNPSRDYSAKLGRRHAASIPFMAELGIQREPKGEDPGFYLGLFWSRSIGRDFGVINTWQAQSSALVKWEGTFASTLAGVELRILLK